ncbi:myosuppressin-like [Bicyclus anynana]|uniref:Myosuppressin-like n=1 Tax=Bicyclus anynana TaxID=110368 RepID=A0ABM3LKU4_BICAN|nr:myosuppressin-like [Bicyclus anynana]
MGWCPANSKVEAGWVVLLVVVLCWCMVLAHAAPAQLCTASSESDTRAARFCQALNTFLEQSAKHSTHSDAASKQAVVSRSPSLTS